MTDAERAPLLLSTEPAEAPSAPPAYGDVIASEQGGSDPTGGGGSASATAAGAKPDAHHRRRVVCEVCRTSLTYADRPGLRVVRCSKCQEATPVGPAPPGKKYLRCACHCLLTCSATSRLVACPRANCNRTVRMTPSNANAVVVTTGRRVTCPRCQVTVTWTGRSFKPTRCYACNGLLPINTGLLAWVKRRAFINLAIGVMFLAIAIIITATTLDYASTHGGIYVVPVGFFVGGFICLVRAAMYYFSTRNVPLD